LKIIAIKSFLSMQMSNRKNDTDNAQDIRNNK